jgi:integrase
MGSIRKVGDGRWQIRAFVGRHPITGATIQRARTIDAPNERAATRELVQWEAELGRTGTLTGENDSLTGALNHWLADHEVSPRTALEYRRIVDKYLTPHLGARKVSRLSVADIDAYYRYLRDLGIGEPQRLKIHRVLSQCLKDCLRRGLIHHNPCTLARAPRQARPTLTTPSVDDVIAVIRAADAQSPEWGRLLWVAFGTGLRRGELAALTLSRWADGVLLIDRAITVVKGGTLLKDTKSHTVRRVPLAPTFEDAIQRQVDYLYDRAKHGEVELVADPWLWSTVADGSQCPHPDTLTHIMVSACRKAGVKARLHDLRHAFAVFLESQGAGLSTLQRLLGHRDQRTTMIYMDTTDAAMRTAIGTFKAIGR